MMKLRTIKEQIRKLMEEKETILEKIKAFRNLETEIRELKEVKHRLEKLERNFHENS